MYALQQCNVLIFTLDICKTNMVLQVKMAVYKGEGLYNGMPLLLNFMGNLLKLEILS
jgi:hypothetical protein